MIKLTVDRRYFADAGLISRPMRSGDWNYCGAGGNLVWVRFFGHRFFFSTFS